MRGRPLPFLKVTFIYDKEKNGKCLPQKDVHFKIHINDFFLLKFVTIQL